MGSVVDARGLSCPQPVLMTLGEIKKLGKGEIEVLVDTDTSKENVMRAAESQGCRVGGVSWVADRPPEGGDLTAKVRYLSRDVPVGPERGEGEDWVLRFREPQSAVTPGQAAVLYRGDEVLGGGTILKALRFS